MIEAVEEREIRDSIQRAPMGKGFEACLNDAPLSATDSIYYGSASYRLETRPREFWNTQGREIYSRKNQEHFAGILCGLWQQLKLQDVLACRVSSRLPCLAGSFQAQRPVFAAEFHQFFSDSALADPVLFSGGLLICPPDEGLSRLLELMICCPYLLRGPDSVLLSLAQPLAMQCSHHLAVLMASTAENLWQNCVAFLVQEGCDARQ